MNKVLVSKDVILMYDTALFNNFPVLESGRLVLRELQTDDGNSIFNIFSDYDTMKYYGLDLFKSINDSTDAIRHYKKGFKNRWIIKWA
jgi:ribosomal-protein-alanine N-acetyltransferase